jgi:hypothetical protein
MANLAFVALLSWRNNKGQNHKKKKKKKKQETTQHTEHTPIAPLTLSWISGYHRKKVFTKPKNHLRKSHPASGLLIRDNLEFTRSSDPPDTRLENQ